MTETVLDRGYQRYMIYCIMCHDPLGTGHGKIVERGYTAPPSYHIQRLRDAPAGYLFAVISEGYGSMPSYAAQIPLRDRWAIAGYLRALQASQHFPAKELSKEMREQWNRQNEHPAAGGRSP
jgi:mono/diheme cytochrome c family protein